MDKKEQAARDQERDRFVKVVEGIDDPVLLILRTHLIVEGFLDRLIALYLPGGDKLLNKARMSFMNKLRLVEAFDIVDDMAIGSALNLNRVRNLIAHDIEKTITISDVELIGRPFGKLFTSMNHEYGADFERLLRSMVTIITVAFAKNTWSYEDFVIHEGVED